MPAATGRTLAMLVPGSIIENVQKEANAIFVREYLWLWRMRSGIIYTLDLDGWDGESFLCTCSLSAGRAGQCSAA